MRVRITLWESLIRTLLVLWESGLGSPRVYIFISYMIKFPDFLPVTSQFFLANFKIFSRFQTKKNYNYTLEHSYARNQNVNDFFVKIYVGPIHSRNLLKDYIVRIWGQKVAQGIQICFCGDMTFKYWVFYEISQNFRIMTHYMSM